eukprot:scaffold69443_cov58-Attheya_sp.AAC.2
MHPCFCAMTGTFTKDHVASLHELLGFIIPVKGMQWGIPEDFSRRDIGIEFSVCDNFTTTARKPFFGHLQKGEMGSIKGILYCNSVKDAEAKYERINTMLDNAVDFVSDVILIHGQQNKLEKFVNTKVFLGQVNSSSLTPVILVATSAANRGIDDFRICYVLRNGLPFGFLSFLQELGLAGRLLRIEAQERDASTELISIENSSIDSAPKGGQIWREISDYNENSRVPTTRRIRIDCAHQGENLLNRLG